MMHGKPGTAVAHGAPEGTACDPSVRIEDGYADSDAESWAQGEAQLCAALVREGKNGREIGPLVAAALRASDALSRQPLPAETRAMLRALALDALRTLACTDGRQRRRARGEA